MRVFIAIDIDEQTRKGIADLQDELRSKINAHRSDIKWVNPELMHLTLKFLGEIKDRQVVDVCNIAAGVAPQHREFDIDVGKVGYFGGKSARVLWIGAGQDCENLIQLHSDLEQQLASAGWPKENRKFTGHLTLARIRNFGVGIELAKLTNDYSQFALGYMPAGSLSVYQSELTPKGPIYTLLGNYKLS